MEEDNPFAGLEGFSANAEPQQNIGVAGRGGTGQRDLNETTNQAGDLEGDDHGFHDSFVTISDFLSDDVAEESYDGKLRDLISEVCDEVGKNKDDDSQGPKRRTSTELQIDDWLESLGDTTDQPTSFADVEELIESGDYKRKSEVKNNREALRFFGRFRRGRVKKKAKNSDEEVDDDAPELTTENPSETVDRGSSRVVRRFRTLRFKIDADQVKSNERQLAGEGHNENAGEGDRSEYDRNEEMSECIRQNTAGLAQVSIIAIAAIFATVGVLIPAYYESPPLSPSSPPPWQPVLTLEIPTTESMGNATILVSSIFLATWHGSGIWVYFARHCAFYFSLVGLAFFVADLIVSSRHEGLNSGEREVRIVLSFSIFLFGLLGWCSFERRVCRKLRWINERERYPSITDEPKGMLTREGKKRWICNFLVATAIAGYQLVAILFTVRSLLDFCYIDQDVNVKEQSPTLGSSLLRAFCGSYNFFGHASLLLALFNAVLLYPKDGSTLLAASLAVLGRIILVSGYAINLLLMGGMDNVDGMWSALFTCLELGFSLMVLVACMWLWPSRESYHPEGDNAMQPNQTRPEDTSHVHHFSYVTLCARFDQYSTSNRRQAKVLYMSSMLLLTVGTVKCILLLIFHSNALYSTHFLVDIVNFGMLHVGIFVFINHLSFQSEQIYGVARYGIIYISASGLYITSWQIAKLMGNCAMMGMGSVDLFVLILLVAALLANSLMLCVTITLRDVKTDNILAQGFLTEDDTSLRTEDDIALRDVKTDNTHSQGTLTEDSASSQDQATLAKSLKQEKNVRRKCRLILYYVYFPAVLAYGLSIVLFTGRNDLGSLVPYPMVNIFQDELDLSLGTRDDIGASNRDGSGAVNRITRLRAYIPFDETFQFRQYRPGLHLFCHSGLILVLLAADGIRVRPLMKASLASASLLATHSFIMLGTYFFFLIDNPFSDTSSEEAGADLGTAQVHSVLGSYVNEYPEEQHIGEEFEIVMMLVWCLSSALLAMSLQLVWNRRVRLCQRAAKIAPYDIGGARPEVVSI